jgi:high-affinity iron transporter
LESGRLIFASRCSECHGALGAGDGPAAALLRTPPPDMSDPHYMAAQRPEYYAEAIRVGVPGTGMPRWDHVLDERAVWDAAFYAWSLGAPEGAAQRGKEAYASQCGRCHASDGMGVAVAPLGGPEFAARTRAEVTEAIVRAHPDLARGLSSAQLADLTEGLFGFLFSDAAGR